MGLDFGVVHGACGLMRWWTVVCAGPRLSVRLGVVVSCICNESDDMRWNCCEAG